MKGQKYVNSWKSKHKGRKTVKKGVIFEKQGVWAVFPKNSFKIMPTRFKGMRLDLKGTRFNIMLTRFKALPLRLNLKVNNQEDGTLCWFKALPLRLNLKGSRFNLKGMRLDLKASMCHFKGMMFPLMPRQVVCEVTGLDLKGMRLHLAGRRLDLKGTRFHLKGLVLADKGNDRKALNELDKV